jgi:O-antigen ligase
MSFFGGTIVNEISKLKNYLLHQQNRVFLITLVYYFSLYFSIHNRSLLILSAIYAIALYAHLRKVGLTLFLVFLATLPFAKGKGFEIILLAKEQILRYTLFKISYFFPLYVSDFFLSLAIYHYVRQKLLFSQPRMHLLLPPRVTSALIALLIFILSVLLRAFTSIFWEVIILSVIQLIKMAIVFCLPFITRLKKIQYAYIFAVILASVIFQSSWVVLQKINQGPLGKDIEVFLPGIELGIYTSEDSTIFRSTGTFFEPSILGTFLLMQMAILSQALLQQRIPAIRRPLFYVGLLMGVMALIFTGSRALYALFIIVVLAFGYVHKTTFRSLLQKTRRQFSMRHVVIVVAIFALLTPYLFARLSSVPDLFATYGSGTYRLQMTIYSLRLASTHMLGTGINLSPYYLATAFNQEKFIFDPTYPHNIFAQLLAETGFVGCALFITFLYLCLRRFPNFIKNPFAPAPLIFLLSAQFYPIFLNHPEISSFLFLYLGLALYDHHV